MKRHAVQWMRELGVQAAVRVELAELRVDLDRRLQTLGGHTALTTLLDRLDSLADEPEPVPDTSADR